MGSLLDDLRQATRPAHERLHGLVDVSTRDGYADFLAGMADVYVPLAARCDLPAAGTIDRLRRDLAELGRPHTPGPTLGIDLEAGGHDGVLYTVAGARVGAASLLAGARGLGVPVRFLTGGLDEPAWPEVRRRLSSLPADAASVRSAVAVFGAIERAMRSRHRRGAAS